VGVAVGVGVCFGVGVAAGVGVAVGAGVGVAVGTGVAVGFGVAVAAGVAVGGGQGRTVTTTTSAFIFLSRKKIAVVPAACGTMVNCADFRPPLVGLTTPLLVGGVTVAIDGFPEIAVKSPA
jgi:hypothetical protein